MCSNISTDTTRSKVPGASNVFMSAVITVRFVRPSRCAVASMNAFCVREFETTTISLPG